MVRHSERFHEESATASAAHAAALKDMLAQTDVGSPVRQAPRSKPKRRS